jgi:hypothetical protein
VSYYKYKKTEKPKTEAKPQGREDSPNGAGRAEAGAGWRRDMIHTDHTEGDDMITKSTETPEIIAYVTKHGCMYHRDNPTQCTAGTRGTYRADGDVWCQAAYDEHHADQARPYGTTGADAQWIYDNVGLD